MLEATIKTLATKDNLSYAIANVKDEFSVVRKEIGEVRADLRKEIGEVKAKIGGAKADNIKWMFLFWVGQMGGSVATIVLLLKK